jgi:hypothetical protein
MLVVEVEDRVPEDVAFELRKRRSQRSRPWAMVSIRSVSPVADGGGRLL